MSYTSRNGDKNIDSGIMEGGFNKSVLSMTTTQEEALLESPEAHPGSNVDETAELGEIYRRRLAPIPANTFNLEKPSHSMG